MAISLLSLLLFSAYDQSGESWDPPLLIVFPKLAPQITDYLLILSISVVLSLQTSAELQA